MTFNKLRDNLSIEGGINSGLTAGSNVAYTLTLSDPDWNSLVDRTQFTLTVHVTSGLNPTLNVNGTGAFPLYKTDGTQIQPNELLLGGQYIIIYENSRYYVINPEFIGSVSGSITINNTLHVMKNGNNSTALPNRLDLPYLTIAGAMTIATSGDTIIIRPGDYTYSTEGSIILKNNVRLKFMEGARLIHDNTSGIFLSDNFTSVVTTIENLQFVFTAGGSGAVGINISNTNSVFDIKGLWSDRQGVLATAGTTLMNCILGTLNVSNLNAINQWSILVIQNGTVNLQGKARQQTGANTTGLITKTGGTLYCNGQFIANTSLAFGAVVNYTSANINGQDYYFGEYINLTANSRCFAFVGIAGGEPNVVINAKCVGQILVFNALYLYIQGNINASFGVGFSSTTTPLEARVSISADMVVSGTGMSITTGNNYRIEYNGTIINTGTGTGSHGILGGDTANRLTVRNAKILLASTTAFSHHSTVANTPLKVGNIITNRPVSANTLLQVNPAGLIVDTVNVV